MRLRMRHKKSKGPKECWFHKWEELGWDGLFTLYDKCLKCGLIRATDVILDEVKYIRRGDAVEIKNEAHELPK